MSTQGTKYPLLPFSQLVYDITRWMPSIYRFPVRYVWPNGAKEKARIEQAIRTAIANHPVFAARVDCRGRQCATKSRDVFHGQYHDIELIESGKDLVIQMTVSRILGDGKSGEILQEDIQRAYRGEPLEPDDYWGYVERFEAQKQSPHYAASRSWLINEFADQSIPVRPAIDRCCLFTLLPPKAGVYTADYSDLQAKIQDLATSSHLSADGFFSLCTALAIAEYCGTDQAALTWAYEGRELPEEQRIFGSLHRDVPFHIRKSENRELLIREARNQIRAGIAHCDYPYTLTAPYSDRWNYAVNVLRAPEMTHEEKYAYALLDVEIHEREQSLVLVYRYSATHYKEQSIRHFARLVRKYAEWLTA